MLQNCPQERIYQFILPLIVNECGRLPFSQPSSCHAFISVGLWQNINSKVDLRRKKNLRENGLFCGSLWITNVKLPSCLGFCGEQAVFQAVCGMLMLYGKCLQLQKGYTRVWCGSRRKWKSPSCLWNSAWENNPLLQSSVNAVWKVRGDWQTLLTHALRPWEEYFWYSTK